MKYEFSETRILSEEAASVLKKSVDSVDEDINWNGLKQLMVRFNTITYIQVDKF